MFVIRDGQLSLSGVDKSELSSADELYAMALECSEETGRSFPSPAECLRGAELPEDGQMENYELLLISIAEIPIGYMSVYRDFPYKAYVSIPFMFIAKPARGLGNGSAALEAVARYFYESGYGALRAELSLAERDAIDFFMKNGFTRPVALRRDPMSDDIWLTVEKPMPGGIII